MAVAAPDSAPLRWLSPSLYEALVVCRLRVSFMQMGGIPSAKRSPAARLGDVCHRVLDEIVKSRSLLSDGWESELRESWEREIDRENRISLEAAEVERPGPVDTWPHYQLKRARVGNLAKRLRALLLNLPSGAELLTEQILVGRGGLLHGRADLVVRSEGSHLIIDYKTGAILDSLTREPVDGYVRQLKLYAVMEREASGRWPDAAFLFPLDAPPVEIRIIPLECEAVASDALSKLDEYNACAPRVQPGSPSPNACAYCPYGCHCPAFWAAYTVAWSPALVAIRGRVQRCTTTPLGGTAVDLALEAGMANAGSVSIRNLSAQEHPAVTTIAVGDTICLIGLREDRERAAYWLPATGKVQVSKQEPNLSFGRT